eukprot:TRINITY_DN1849_c0_g1_i3.p1 TRINITY_DN1849_c0_g1~~TRINITY_DN1849_c0_g1_i3.p1  ORF type:complete len:1081 (+),score=249.42 TRINITY_DN1849_c0_g1_i3:2-3244(+)
MSWRGRAPDLKRQASVTALEDSLCGKNGFKQGFVQSKEGTGPGKRIMQWFRRWLVLTHSSIAFYSSERETLPVAEVSFSIMTSVTEAGDSDTSRPNCFKLVVPQRQYVISLENRDDLEAWMHAVRHVFTVSTSKNPGPISVVRELGESLTQLLENAHLCAASLNTFPVIQTNVRESIAAASEQSIALQTSASVAVNKTASAKPGAVVDTFAIISPAARKLLETLQSLAAAIQVSKAPNAESAKLVETSFVQLRIRLNDMLEGAAGPSSPATPVSPRAGQPPAAEAEGGTTERRNSTRRPSMRSRRLLTATASRRIMSSSHDSVPLATGDGLPSGQGGTSTTTDVDPVEAQLGEQKDLIAQAAKEAAMASRDLFRIFKTDEPTDEDILSLSKQCVRALLGMIQIGETVLETSETQKLQPTLSWAIHHLRQTATDLLGLVKSSAGTQRLSSSDSFKSALSAAVSSMGDTIFNLVVATQACIQHNLATRRLKNALQESQSLTEDDGTGVSAYKDVLSRLYTLTQAAEDSAYLLGPQQTPVDADAVQSAKLIAKSTFDLIESSIKFSETVASRIDESLERQLPFSRESVREASVEHILSIKSRPKNVSASPEVNKLALQVTSSAASLSFAASQFFLMVRDSLLSGLDDEDMNDVNIYDEPPDVDNIVLEKREGKEDFVRSGSLNVLVERLTSNQHVDLHFMKTFITTYRSFTTPHHLFEKLLQRYDVPTPKLPPNVSVQEFVQKHTLPIRLRVCNVMKFWIETSFSDLNEQLVASIKDFINSSLSEDGLEKLGEQLLRAINKNSFEQRGRAGTVARPPPPEGLLIDRTQLLLECDSLKVAQHLTLIDWAIYSAIKPVELLNLNWSKAKYKHRSPNVLAMIERFNLTSAWVATTIVSAEKLKLRTQLLLKFIDILSQLHKLNNYNSLLAIISGLGNSSVHRLRHTFSQVPKPQLQIFEQMQELMNGNQSYRNFRAALHLANPPCIPYLGMYLTDLTFIEDGNTDTVASPSGKLTLINFRKREMVYLVIREVQQYQNVAPTYKFGEDDQSLDLHQLLLDLPKVSEKEMYNQSLKIEPRNAAIGDLQ